MVEVRSGSEEEHGRGYTCVRVVQREQGGAPLHRYQTPWGR